ncbi:hypothetical protein M0R45_015690 [Rubus argutus]|uniref:Uncharacterized protein n=1 Tax=Rubus argutus TaxID=59490 RepID=A0AAW1XSD0_RUBAR
MNPCSLPLDTNIIITVLTISITVANPTQPVVSNRHEFHDAPCSTDDATSQLLCPDSHRTTMISLSPCASSSPSPVLKQDAVVDPAVP